MATAALTRYTPEEYLALERNAEFRSEYIDGQIVAMSPGARRPHNLIVAALVSRLEEHLLDSPCEVYPSTQRVKVNALGDYLYPDVMVSCDPQFEDDHYDNLLTPLLIIEVLSDSTERRDREKKFARYKRIKSLREYVLISQKEARIEQYVRSGDLWPQTVVTGTDASLVLASVGVEIPLKRLYQKALLPTRRVPWVVQDEE
jgi:Uma2 family endonuclease